MLPSRGFFKKNDCPYFVKGLCERPHCHFRHRKKVVSENSSSTDSQDLISESFSGIPTNDNETTENATASEQFDTSTTTDANTEVQGDQSNHDSLFAKLVNQSNPYGKTNRHIPCAYTPTPQITSAQPKNRVVSANSNVNNSKVLDILAKTQNYSDGYNSVNVKQNSNSYTLNKNFELNSLKDISNNLINESKNKYSVDSTSSSIFSKTSEYDASFFKKNSDSLPYEPQSASKKVISDIQKTLSDGCTSSYVPSKHTIPETKYVPDCNGPSLPNDYVPSKDKSKQTVYVPEGSGTLESQVTYKPSDKYSSQETPYQPETSKIVADYVPTEKSATKPATNKNEWTEFDFISSEIEMMKKLLSEDEKAKIKEENKVLSETDTSDKDKKIEDNKKPSEKSSSSSRSRHSSSSRHKSKSSSHSHSSSKSRHSSSSSSKHSSRTSGSSRHHSSSSRHHSHSSSKKSSDHSKSSSDYKKSSSSSRSRSSSHKSSRHHTHSNSSKREKGRSSKEKRSSEQKKNAIVNLGSDEEDSSEELSNKNISGEDSGNSDGDSNLKKRKNSDQSDEREKKIMKISDDELFGDMEDDPETVEKECLEIFNSYTKPADTNLEKKINETTIPTEDYESVTMGKKRTAHSTDVLSDHSVLRLKTVKKTNTIKSAQEVMLERYKAKEAAVSLPTPMPHPAPIAGLNRPSVRIAAVSNIQQILQAKKAIQEKINQGMKVNERTTIAQTVSRKGTRVAHTSKAENMASKTTITVGSKVIPPVKRQIYLDKLLLETNQIYPTKDESAEEALKMEDEVFKAHSGSLAAYHSAFVSLLMKTRRRLAAVKGESFVSNSRKPKVSHFDILSGGKKNFSVIKTKKVDISMLTEKHIYEELLRCKLTPEELKINSYPMEGSKSGYATCTLNFELKYNAHYLHIKKLSGNRRYCVRCSKEYEVHPVTLKQYIEGPETCSYHPGKKKSGGRNSERIYNCCNSSSTEGCATHIRHVTDCNDYENLPNCVKTLSKDDESNPGVYALDCEMVYTRLGYELARVTVVNLKKEIVYDTLVKPKYPVECYNTFYSGIEEKMMKGVETTLSDVQAVLLNMFSDKTILIGHSLDSDLRALHLIHDTVVDTAVVYKHEKFHPYKYSLRELCAKKISKIIQENVGGHDSAEDAIAALEIMLNYVKEEVSKYDSLESYEADRMR